MAATKNLVLRTVYMDPDVDDALRNEAFSGRTSKNDLIRDYILIGMRAVEAARRQNPDATAADVVAASPSAVASGASAAKKNGSLKGTVSAAKKTSGTGKTVGSAQLLKSDADKKPGVSVGTTSRKKPAVVKRTITA